MTITLADEIDISRGDMIVRAGETPRVDKQFDAMLCWLSETPLDPRWAYPQSMAEAERWLAEHGD